MDKKTALKIIGIDDSATYETAKKAYRKLAKKYHPDVAGQDPLTEKETEAKMKEINLAFRFLAPMIRSNDAGNASKENRHDTAVEKEVNPEREKEIKTSFWSSMMESLSHFFSNPNDVGVTEKKSGKQNRKQNPAAEKILFEDVLRQVRTPGDWRQKKTGSGTKKRRSRKNASYRGYQTYMTLKKKMRSGRSGRHQQMGIGRVAEIDPVKKVQPVGRK